MEKNIIFIHTFFLIIIIKSGLPENIDNTKVRVIKINEIDFPLNFESGFKLQYYLVL